MSFNHIASQLVGEWTGEYNLWVYPGDPVRTSPSKALVEKIVGSKFLQIKYDWKYENNDIEGNLIIGWDNKRNRLVASWIDSWHQQSDFMTCEGYISENGVLVVKGSYPVDNAPSWEWRTKVFATDSGFTFEMYNIHPQGIEELAVKVEYLPV